jgi:competence protein ComGF
MKNLGDIKIDVIGEWLIFEDLLREQLDIADVPETMGIQNNSKNVLLLWDGDNEPEDNKIEGDRLYSLDEKTYKTSNNLLYVQAPNGEVIVNISDLTLARPR